LKVSFLTTYRYCDQYRLVNLERVLAHISTEFPDWEIVVVEQDEESTLGSHALAKNIKYLHAYNPGPFNKSWGMNVAFRQSSGDILIVSDADMLIQAVDLQRAVSACEKEMDAVRPYGVLIDMTADETKEFLQHGELPDVPAEERGYDREHVKESLCTAGGIYIITREFFVRSGGMDERFSGWGGEDDAMSVKMQSMSLRVAIARNATGWHLWHPRSERYDHDGYQLNRNLLQHYQQLSKNEMVSLCRQQYSAIGNTEKYRANEQQVAQAPLQSESSSGASAIVCLFPEKYGEVQLSGPNEYNRKFGIVISSCGRSEYLKQCLVSLTKSDLSRAVVCIVDETESSKIEVEGFTCFEGVDYPELDIKRVDHNLDTILLAIEREPSCNLFNDRGWLKRNIQSPSRLTVMHPRHGLYVRNSYLDENPDIADFLIEMTSKNDTEAADILRQFSIEGVPVIKVFKKIHRNMFDSLRSGWGCLENMGCEYLVNLDADAVVGIDWLARLESTYEQYKKEKPGSSFIVTGFNSATHDVVHMSEAYALKKSAGGINIFFHNSIYSELVRPVLSSVDWDHVLSEKLARRNGSIVVTVPSVVQHIGKFGLWSRPDELSEYALRRAR
jgi:cellulose synthase/poly-beta-1,6-N-acetylglucosamine synthase-like glycosyltransferase